MSQYLDDYVEVPERIIQFRERYPDGTLQAELVPSPVEGFIVVKAYAYRTPDDQRPGVGWAWEPVPGKSNFTRDSELMNAETSAWGRALIAVGAADAKRGIASANEVRNRQQTTSRPASETSWQASARERLAKLPWPDRLDEDDESLYLKAGLRERFDLQSLADLEDHQWQQIAVSLSTSSKRKRFVQDAIEAVEGSEGAGEGKSSSPSDTPPEPSDSDRLWADVQAVWRKLGIQGPRVLTHARMIVSQDELDDSEGRVEWDDPRDLGPDAHPDVLRGLLSWLEDQQAKAGAA